MSRCVISRCGALVIASDRFSHSFTGSHGGTDSTSDPSRPSTPALGVVCLCGAAGGTGGGDRPDRCSGLSDRWLADSCTVAGRVGPRSVSYTHLRAHETRHDL